MIHKEIEMDAPGNRYLALQTYIKAVKGDILRALDRGPQHCPHNNLTSQERKALLSLRTQQTSLLNQLMKDLLQW